MAEPGNRSSLVIATGNAGKLREYRQLLQPTGLDLVPFDGDVEETGATYAENAALKAAAGLAATGLPAIGDDSGIEVAVLGGFPGLRSARLGPTQAERTAILLEMLSGLPRPWPARFTCTIALAAPGQPIRYVEGERHGEVVPEWRGQAGFGYDPIFLIPELGVTFGELDPVEKHRWSHRGAAVARLIETGWLS